LRAPFFGCGNIPVVRSAVVVVAMAAAWPLLRRRRLVEWQRRDSLWRGALARHRMPAGLGVGTRERRLWRVLQARIQERDCRPNVIDKLARDVEWFVADYFYVGAVEVRAPPISGCAV
jgi:hypothetical protein